MWDRSAACGCCKCVTHFISFRTIRTQNKQTMHKHAYTEIRYNLWVHDKRPNHTTMLQRMCTGLQAPTNAKNLNLIKDPVLPVSVRVVFLFSRVHGAVCRIVWLSSLPSMNGRMHLWLFLLWFCRACHSVPIIIIPRIVINNKLFF